MKYNKGFAPLILVAIIAGALVIGGGAYYLGKNSNNKEVKLEEKNVLQENQIVDGSQKDYFNEDFTINESQNSISTTLPAKYIGAKNWPPVVQRSTIQYSCIPNSGSGDVPKTVIQKKINNKTYCITSMIDAGAGQRFGEYTYTTINGNGTKTVSFELGWSSCGGYGGPGDIEYDQCQITVSGFLNNLDAVIDSLMSK